MSAMGILQPVAPSVDGCPSCRSGAVVDSGAEQFCGNCGLVFDVAPVVKVGTGLESSNTFGLHLRVNPGVHSRVSASVRRDLYRANRTATRVAPYRHEWEARRVVQQVGLALDAPPSIMARAERLYQLIQTSDKILRQPRHAIAGVAYTIAYREFGIARTLRDVAKASGVDPYFLGRRVRYIGRVLGIAVMELSPEAYLRTFLERLGWDSRQRAIALDTLNRYRTFMVTEGGASPSSSVIAAAAVSYVALNSAPRVTRNTIQAVTGLSHVALRTVCRQAREAVRSTSP